MQTKSIFVFGSNLAGRHGAGAALTAKSLYGAQYGQGEGLQGNSYAIPTKDGRNKANLRLSSQTLSLEQIKEGVDRFIEFAKNNPEMRFNVIEIGCGLAGYKPHQIGPLFRDSPINCYLPLSFLKAIESEVDSVKLINN